MGNIHDVDGESKRPDFVISDHEGQSCAPAFLELVVGHLRAQGFDVAVNFPFKGAELTRRYADPAGGRHALQIEINRKLYMDEMAIEKNTSNLNFFSIITGNSIIVAFATKYLD